MKLIVFLVITIAGARSYPTLNATSTACDNDPYSDGCFEYCTSKTTCASCAPTESGQAMGQCAWCESTLQCGPWNGQAVDPNNGLMLGKYDPHHPGRAPEHGWSCTANAGNTKGTVVYGHNYQCGVIDEKGHPESGPTIMQAKPDDDSIDLTAVPTSGGFDFHLTLQNVGEKAHGHNLCPGSACNQTIAVGPFNCTVYADDATNFKEETGSTYLDIDYVCKALPGIGWQPWPIQIIVSGMPKSTFSSVGDHGHEPTNKTLTYAKPTISSIQLHTTPGGAGEPCGGATACKGYAGSTLAITGANFPANQGVVDTWEAYMEQSQDGFQIKIGGTPCTMSNFTSPTEATCIVPPVSGLELPITVSVGGADSEQGGVFSFGAPEIAQGGVKPEKGPSYGGITVTITGQHFGSSSFGGTSLEVVFHNPSTGANLTAQIQDDKWSDTQVVVTQPTSNSSAAVDFEVWIKAGPQWTAPAHMGGFQAAACSDHCSGDNLACLSTGECVCGGNFVPKHGEDFQTTCTCPANPCKGGSTFTEKTCSCTCRADPQHWQPTPAPAPDAEGTSKGTLPPPATCNACTQACSGSLQQSVPSEEGDDCLCHFNGVHVIWMVALGLIVVGGIAGGVWWYKKKQSDDAAYLAYTESKQEADRDSYERESGSTAFM